ncbi:SPOR domain-containing protein [Mucilaginibacter terrae]|uniref:SPOR domain-containing protein n=1 Tax=Mucilaginibacter terrae TaxID=1955052 RepID=A0ABU3GRT2_9SPHI|nr:hypothetical protein [Mucilaginibacter terrae]MDT3402483.1 hypothetical protein [Mucilaginibacter terrae]
MDLSVYISELLNEHGTISIPQIGVFKQVRKRGYYNTDEGKLYPPYFETAFEQQPVNDDTLLRYLIEKSKVSASSAKFFLDRYVQNIVQQAEIGEAMIGNLGWLSKEVDTITFRPAANINAGSAVFGFSPVSVSKELPQTKEEVEEALALAAQDNTPETLQHTPIEPKTFSVEKELVEAPAPQPLEQDTTQPTVKVTATEQHVTAEPDAAKTYSIEKELPATPQVSVKEEDVVIAPKAKPTISPLVRQHKPAEKPKQPIIEDIAVPVPPAAPVTSVEPTVTEEYSQPAKPFYLRPLFYAVAIFVILACGAIYMLINASGDTRNSQQPSTAGPVAKSNPSTDSVVVKNTAPDTVVIKSPAPTDTTIRNTALPESTEFAPEVETPISAATPIVNSNNYKFVLIGGSYGTYEQAMAASNRYKAVGISASPFENARKLYKVALGYYKTYAEGQQAKQDFVKQGKVLSWKLYVETLRK